MATIQPIHPVREPGSIEDLVRDWPRSGLTQRVYCERHGIALSTFSYWRRRLRGEPIPCEESRQAMSEAIEFREIVISDDMSPSERRGDVESSGISAYSVEIVLINGVVVRVARDVEPLTLRAILEQAASSC